MEKLSLLILLLPVSALAEDCTSMLNAYLKGLNTSASQLSSKQAKHVMLEIERIEQLRLANSDCEVKAQIPAFQATEEALNAATEAIKR